MRRRIPLPPGRRDWNEKLLDFLCGQVSEEQLLPVAGQSRWDLCDGYFYLGLCRLADGDPVAAKSYFQACVNTNVYWWFEWESSRLFLARMRQDPEWPRWIPKTK
jgi:lipoprotein NlpI